MEIAGSQIFARRSRSRIAGNPAWLDAAQLLEEPPVISDINEKIVSLFLEYSFSSPFAVLNHSRRSRYKFRFLEIRRKNIAFPFWRARF